MDVKCKNAQWSRVFSGFSEHVVAVVFLYTGGYFGEVSECLVRVVDTFGKFEMNAKS